MNLFANMTKEHDFAVMFTSLIMCSVFVRGLQLYVGNSFITNLCNKNLIVYIYSCVVSVAD